MENINKQLRSNSYSVSCSLCSIGDMCIPMLESDTLCSVLNRREFYQKSQVLAAQGQPLDRYFVIHSGALMTYVTTDEGIEQINGFYLPGDIVGLDGFCTQEFNNSVRALTNTQVCEMRYDELTGLIEKNKVVRDMVFRLMSLDIYNYQRLILSYSQKNAEEKLAFFMYSLYKRYSMRGHNSLMIKLSMRRAEIANYLGLTIETVSRVFSRLQELDILEAKGKFVQIKSLSKLIKLSGEKE